MAPPLRGWPRRGQGQSYQYQASQARVMPQRLRVAIPDAKARLEAVAPPSSSVTGSSFTIALNPITRATAMPGVTAGTTTCAFSEAVRHPGLLRLSICR